MRPIDIFYQESLKHFKESEGNDDEYKWLVGARLALFNSYKKELNLRFKLLNELCKKVRGRVLDVGSGSGFPALTFSLLDNVKKVIGIEKRSEYSDFLSKLEKKNEKLRFIYVDFLKLPTNLGKFDSVVFFYILHDFEPETYLNKAVEFLSPGGQLLIADFDIKGLRENCKIFCRDRDLEIVEDKIIGSANTHGVVASAFVLIIQRKDRSKYLKEPPGGFEPPTC